MARKYTKRSAEIEEKKQNYYTVNVQVELKSRFIYKSIRFEVTSDYRVEYR